MRGVEGGEGLDGEGQPDQAEQPAHPLAAVVPHNGRADRGERERARRARDGGDGSLAVGGSDPTEAGRGTVLGQQDERHGHQHYGGRPGNRDDPQGTIGGGCPLWASDRRPYRIHGPPTPGTGFNANPARFPIPRDAAYWAKQVTTLELGEVPAEAINLNVAGKRVVG